MKEQRMKEIFGEGGVSPTVLLCPSTPTNANSDVGKSTVRPLALLCSQQRNKNLMPESQKKVRDVSGQ